MRLVFFCFFLCVEGGCFWYLPTSFAGSSYMQISTSSSTNSSSTARLMSFPRPVGRVICVSFWYRIFGNSIGMFFIVSYLEITLVQFGTFLESWGATIANVHPSRKCVVLFAGSLKFLTKPSGGEETLVWLRSGTQGNRWRFADLSFKNDQPIQVMIVAVLFPLLFSLR